MLKVTYLSHSCFLFDNGDFKVIIDPFISGNPTCPEEFKNIIPDYIIVTHAHGDHLGDALELSKKNGTTIVAVNELANFINANGGNAHNMHIGGSHSFPFGKVKFTIAHHGSAHEDKYMGEPAGVILTMNDRIIYHTGDTGIFYDMKLIGEMNEIDLYLCPIGDNYTMGIDDAVKSIDFVNPKMTSPMHYNTFPIIQADPNEFKEKAENNGKKCFVFNYGETIEL